MELLKGQIVLSRAGRDVTHIYMVVGLKAGRALLANGAKWTLAAPKKKNIRHIAPTKTVLAQSQAESDVKLKAALAAYEAARGADEQGG